MLAAGSASLHTCYLKPGEIHFSREPIMVTTVLGSCICVTMYHNNSQLAAICHAVLPSSAEATNKTQGTRNTFQYVDTSIEWMLRQFEGNGIRHPDIEVKMFGGAEMFIHGTTGNRPVSVGKKNIDMAIKTIEKSRLKLKAWNVGGNKGRKVIFNTLTGDVFAKFVNKTDVTMTLPDSRRTL